MRNGAVRLRWVVVAVILPVLIGGLAMAVLYWRWARVINVRRSLNTVYGHVEQFLDDSQATAVGAHRQDLQKCAVDAVRMLNAKAGRHMHGRWAAWRQDRLPGGSSEHIDSRVWQATPIVIVLLDADAGAGSAIDVAEVEDGQILVSTPNTSRRSLHGNGERIVVLFASGEVTQMTAEELSQQVCTQNLSSK